VCCATLLAVVMGAVVAARADEASAAAKGPAIVPQPRKIEPLAGATALKNGTAICYAKWDESAREVAVYVADVVRRTHGIQLEPWAGCSGSVAQPAVLIETSKSFVGGPEDYVLTVGPAGVEIHAGTHAGLFYGGVTLWQLLTQTPGAAGPVKLTGMRIEDGPRFAWRGMMLDSARHYQSVEYIEQLIDQMAQHKLNTLHWHFCDDQAWRIEIKRYPKLTSVGAFRVDAGPVAAHDIDAKTGKPREYGLFYTQDEVRHLVKYAAERNVTIVPEVEMPGHSTAVIAAYPELASTATPPTAPANTWGIHTNLYNVDDATFTFLENVLTEIMHLFPGQYIHVGGDEAVKDQWKSNPAVQERMKALGVKDEDELQSYFIQRIEKFLNGHGRRLVGWDEILQGGLAPNATVMSWHGVAGGMTAAKAGHDAVLSPVRPLYFNYRQGDGADEPPGRAPLNTLKDVYDFEPAPSEKLTEAERAHILGVQANIWTEFIRTDARVEYMLFPRGAALAEVGWSPEKREWQSFLQRLTVQYARYDALKQGVADTAFRVRTDETLNAAAHTVTVALRSQAEYGTIRYTLDGSAPKASSAEYAQPLTLKLPTELRAATFADGLAVTPGITRTLDELSVRRRDGREMQPCSDIQAIQIDDDAPLHGPRAVFYLTLLNPCWIYKDAVMDGITNIEAGVGQIPWNFEVAKTSKPVLHPPQTPDGELEVFDGKCTGTPLVSLPLAPAKGNEAITKLKAEMPKLSGKHDLCFTFTRATNDWVWAINWVQLVPQGGLK
jgi:hexosaminidase